MSSSTLNENSSVLLVFHSYGWVIWGSLGTSEGTIALQLFRWQNSIFLFGVSEVSKCLYILKSENSRNVLYLSLCLNSSVWISSSSWLGKKVLRLL